MLPEEISSVISPVITRVSPSAGSSKPMPYSITPLSSRRAARRRHTAPAPAWGADFAICSAACGVTVIMASAGAPGPRLTHAGDLSGLLVVAVGKEHEQVVAPRLARALELSQVLHDMAGIRRNVVLLVVLAHEVDHRP